MCNIIWVLGELNTHFLKTPLAIGSVRRKSLLILSCLLGCSICSQILEYILFGSCFAGFPLVKTLKTKEINTLNL